MGKIYIIGLGPGSIDSLTLGALKRIKSGDRNFLRTDKHPTVNYLLDNNIEYKSYDYLYEEEEDFQDLYKRIVEEVIKEADRYESINYLVPGNPFVAEKTVELLFEQDLDLEIVSGMSFIEPMIELVRRDPIKGLKLVDGAEFHHGDVDINTDMIITQVYNRRILSEIKLVLSDVLGDEHEVYLIHGAGIEGREEKHLLPIYQLDRVKEIGVLTSIYVPKMAKIDKKVFDFNDLLGIMKILRSEGGCPWDMEQTHQSIRQSVIEEAYELVDAIDKGDIDELVEELGDLLLQVIFHVQIGSEEGDFTLHEVTSGLANKLIYRHPHIFSDKTVENPQEVLYNWDKLKYAKRDIHSFTDILRDIPKLPALMVSYKMQEKAAKIGFDWDNIEGPMDKVMEEYKEVLEAIKSFDLGDKRIEDELGDLLFAIVNLARFLEVNPEVALNSTINKFIRRFEYMEGKIEELGKDFDSVTMDDMDMLWNEAKTHGI